MKDIRTLASIGCFTALGLVTPVALQAQVTINASDMFNQPGQYYKAYSNATNTSVGVTTMLGTTGGPQLWDFTTGPNDITYRFDYVATTNAAHSAAFIAAGAKMAEIKTDLAANLAEAWLFFTQDPTKGRMTYGFFDPSFRDIGGGILLDRAQELFIPPINDFPATIQYGSTWSCSTTFTNTVTFLDPLDPDGYYVWDFRFRYSSSALADGYGVINSPGIGFGDGLRVNELVTYIIDVDWGDGSGWTELETDYLRNYYWLRPGRGIVAQVTSQQSNSGPPPNDFPIATAVLRMFETNHRDAGDTGGNTGIQGFKMTLGGSGALLQWTTQPSLTHYRVDYSTNLVNGWQVLVASTAANYAIDPLAGKPGYPVRLYRVVGFP